MNYAHFRPRTAKPKLWLMQIWSPEPAYTTAGSGDKSRCPWDRKQQTQSTTTTTASVDQTNSTYSTLDKRTLQPPYPAKQITQARVSCRAHCFTPAFLILYLQRRHRRHTQFNFTSAVRSQSAACTPVYELRPVGGILLFCVPLPWIQLNGAEWKE